MDLVVFENNKPFVIDEFREGRFDYVELASDVAETKFFQFLFGQQVVDRLVQHYPSPRDRHHVGNAVGFVAGWVLSLAFVAASLAALREAPQSRQTSLLAGRADYGTRGARWNGRLWNFHSTEKHSFARTTHC